MNDDGMGSVINAGKAGQIDTDITGRKSRRYLHNSAKHQLGTNGRQGDVPKLLPPVSDTVHGSRLIQRNVHALQTGDKYEKAGAEA